MISWSLARLCDALKLDSSYLKEIGIKFLLEVSWKYLCLLIIHLKLSNSLVCLKSVWQFAQRVNCWSNKARMWDCTQLTIIFFFTFCSLLTYISWSLSNCSSHKFYQQTLTKVSPFPIWWGDSPDAYFPLFFSRCESEPLDFRKYFLHQIIKKISLKRHIYLTKVIQVFMGIALNAKVPSQCEGFLSKILRVWSINEFC
jgi:hypothetical protein